MIIPILLGVIGVMLIVCVFVGLSNMALKTKNESLDLKHCKETNSNLYNQRNHLIDINASLTEQVDLLKEMDKNNKIVIQKHENLNKMHENFIKDLRKKIINVYRDYTMKFEVSYLDGMGESFKDKPYNGTFQEDISKLKKEIVQLEENINKEESK